MRGKYIIQGTFWILVYLFLVCAPLLLLLIGEKPEGREFWRELSVALGFAGLAMLSLQFVLTAALKELKLLMEPTSSIISTVRSHLSL